jgi:ABC-2 type transport system ATP-binding protein
VALSSLSFCVQKGEAFGIIGPNGAGKSTALKILMGFVRADSGICTLMGQNPFDPSNHQRLGYLPENPCLYDNLTAAEHLRFAARCSRFSSRETSESIEKILSRLNLIHAANIPVRRYSKGMVQRAALALALIHDPDILILDEPMSGLDPIGRSLVVDIVREYMNNGKTVLFCSHILTDVERICSRIGIMSQGRLAATTTPQELQEASSPSNMASGSTTPLESFFMQTVFKDAQ